MGDGLLTRWYNSETLRVQAIEMNDLDTLKVQTISQDCVKLPIVKPKPDEMCFADFANKSPNVWIIACFWIMFFVYFSALLWMFTGQ